MFQHDVDVPPGYLFVVDAVEDVQNASLAAHKEVTPFRQYRRFAPIWTPAHPDNVAHAFSMGDCRISHEVGEIGRKSFATAVLSIAVAPAAAVVES